MRASDSPVVHVVDDDIGVRESLSLLLRSDGHRCETYDSATEFLDRYQSGGADCLVADIRMPGTSGLELQQILIDRDIDLPIVFITGHGDVSMAVDAMKAGALDFLQKPFRDQELLDRVAEALRVAAERRAGNLELEEIRRRLARLTPREAEVMEHVVRGSANKVIAMDLGVSQRTVELHRARVMRKAQVRSLAELVRLAERARDQ